MKFPFCCFSKHSRKTREYINEVRQRDVNTLALRYPETQHRVMGLVMQLWFSSSSLTLSCSHIKSMAAVYEHRNAGFSTLWNMHSCQTCQHHNYYVQTRATTCKICPNTIGITQAHTCVHNDTEHWQLDWLVLYPNTLPIQLDYSSDSAFIHLCGAQTHLFNTMFW